MVRTNLPLLPFRFGTILRCLGVVVPSGGTVEHTALEKPAVHIGETAHISQIRNLLHVRPTREKTFP